MIEYLYTGTIKDFSKQIAIEVLGLADAYGIENLKVLCENSLIHSVDNENVADFLMDAHWFAAVDLKKFCMDFITKNFNDVKGLDALENAPSLLLEITKSIASKT